MGTSRNLSLLCGKVEGVEFPVARVGVLRPERTFVSFRQ